MARRHEKTNAERIFENILFLDEVFGDKADADRRYRFSNWQNGFNYLTQDPCAPTKDPIILGRVE